MGFISIIGEARAGAQGRNWGQDLSRSHGRVLLTSLFLMPCSPCFLIVPRTTRLSRALATVIRVLSCQLRKAPQAYLEADMVEAFS